MGYFHPTFYLHIIKLISFRDDVTDTSAKMATLEVAQQLVTAPPVISLKPLCIQTDISVCSPKKIMYFCF